MANSDYVVRIVPSLLDRLLDPDPKNPRPPGAHAETLRELRAAVLRDLENLLNSRNSYADLPPSFVEAGQSVLTYGLPDLTTLSSRGDERRLRQAIDNAIRTFEPRLVNVSTTILPVVPTDRTLRIRVDARLQLEPHSEPVSFDIVTGIPASYKAKESS